MAKANNIISITNCTSHSFPSIFSHQFYVIYYENLSRFCLFSLYNLMISKQRNIIEMPVFLSMCLISGGRYEGRTRLSYIQYVIKKGRRLEATLCQHSHLNILIAEAAVPLWCVASTLCYDLEMFDFSVLLSASLFNDAKKKTQIDTTKHQLQLHFRHRLVSISIKSGLTMTSLRNVICM